MTDLRVRLGPNADGILAALCEQVRDLDLSLRPVAIGTVIDVADGIVRISGLTDVMGEMLDFEDETLGMVLNLEVASVGAIVLGRHQGIVEGGAVRALGQLVSVPVGEALLGRVVDALGRPMDDKGPMRANRLRPVEYAAPGHHRSRAGQYTLADRHQGHRCAGTHRARPAGADHRRPPDRQDHASPWMPSSTRARTTCSACMWRSGRNYPAWRRWSTRCSATRRLNIPLSSSAEASCPVALQYLAPYAGCAIGEEFMYDGRDVLIVYDDLTKHAWAYRQISLLLRRPPGREAFPAAMFLSSLPALLERAGT